MDFFCLFVEQLPGNKACEFYQNSDSKSNVCIYCHAATKKYYMIRHAPSCILWVPMWGNLLTENLLKYSLKTCILVVHVICFFRDVIINLTLFNLLSCNCINVYMTMFKL